MIEKKKKSFGLLGSNIDYSFSANYFNSKFQKENLAHYQYKNYDIEDINLLQNIIASNANLIGLNVTIPYKEAVLSFLDKISEDAKQIGAVNTIVINNNTLTGYNTDYYGFIKSIKPILKPHHTKALILGTGGASKAIAFALDILKIKYQYVSRYNKYSVLQYSDINKSVFDDYSIIINTTPLGTFPDIEQSPPLNYSFFTTKHIAFDLVYNPEETSFLKQAKKNGAQIKNGYEMLIWQAEKSWEIWNYK